MNSTVAAVRRPSFEPATLCRMSELRRLVQIAGDDTTLNDGTTMAATTTITTTSTHHVTPLRDFVPGHLTGTTSGAQVRRNLFGPIDREENIRFVQQELQKISNDSKLEWNYDFQTDRPLEGKYVWEPTNVAQMPGAYHPLHLETTSQNCTVKCVPPSRAPKAAMAQSQSKKSRALKMPSAPAKARRTLSFSSDQEDDAPGAADPPSGRERLTNECRTETVEPNSSSCEALERVTEDLSSNKEDSSNEGSVDDKQKKSSKRKSSSATSRDRQPDRASSKQTSMTDFLKHRKRTLSTSDDASTSAAQPALKKSKPDQE